MLTCKSKQTPVLCTHLLPVLFASLKMAHQGKLHSATNQWLGCFSEAWLLRGHDIKSPSERGRLKPHISGSSDIPSLTLHMSFHVMLWHANCKRESRLSNIVISSYLESRSPSSDTEPSLVGLFYLKYYWTHKHYNTSQQDGRAEVKNNKCKLTHFFSVQLQQRQQTLVTDPNQCLSKICQQRQENTKWIPKNGWSEMGFRPLWWGGAS